LLGWVVSFLFFDDGWVREQEFGGVAGIVVFGWQPF
jgi:hypothetical protein